MYRAQTSILKPFQVATYVKSDIHSLKGEGVADYIKAFSLLRPLDFAYAVNAKVAGKHALNFVLQCQVPFCLQGQSGRNSTFGHIKMAGKAGNQQYFANRLGPIVLLVIVNRVNHRLNGGRVSSRCPAGDCGAITRRRAK